MRKALFLVLLAITLPNAAVAQDLDRLRERVSAMWVDRVAGDRAKASQYVQEKDRANFVGAFEPGLKSARLSSIEFVENKPEEMLVTVKTRVQLPVIGEMDRAVVERWVWVNRNWFLRMDPVANPFSTGGSVVSGPFVAGPPTIKFELLDKELDLGEHNQGEILSGIVRFRAPRASVRDIRGTAGPVTLRIKEVKWEDANGGTIEFSIYTENVAEDIHAKAVFEAIGPTAFIEPVVSQDSLSLSARIHGRLRVTQSPEVLDMNQDGRGEIRIENVGNSPFRLQRAESTTTDFEVTSPGPIDIAPGQILRIPVTYRAHQTPVDGRILLAMAPGVLPSNVLEYTLILQQPKDPTKPGK